MDWAVLVTKVGNGYIVTFKDENGKLQMEVFEEYKDDELLATEKMLWFLLEHFDMRGSKHDSERIKIVREKN